MIRPSSFVCSVMLLSTAHAQSPTIHHWPLNGSSGTTAWDHVGDAHGTLVGNATWAPTGGRFAGAVRFDGVSGRMQTGPCDLTNGGGGISLTAWIKPDLVTAMERTLIAKAGAADGVVWSLALVNATALRFRLLTGGVLREVVSSPALITSGTWYFLSATYDGAEMRIYVNGALIASAPATGGIGHHPSVPVALGAIHNGQHPFSGWMDDVRIHDRGLTPAEVIDLLFEQVSVGLTGPMQLGDGPWTSIELLDMQGRLVKRMDPSSMQGFLPPPHDLASGMHVLRATGPQGVRTRRVFLP
jgi:hypothetical protein